MKKYIELQEKVDRVVTYKRRLKQIEDDADVRLAIIENEILAEVDDMSYFIRAITDTFKKLITDLEKEIKEILKDL